MRSFARATVLLVLILSIPIVPFLLLGESFEQQIESFLQESSQASVSFHFFLIVGVLAIDLFLPIPSSAVSTYGGGVLGTGLATLASWIGMTVGAVVGFWLARTLGKPFTSRFVGEQDRQRMEGFARRFGPLALVLTRALPILAEACVLLMGTTQLSWRRFLVPVVVCNLLVSFSYAACGEFFQGKDALPVAVVASGTIPLLLALSIRRWVPKHVWDNWEQNDS